MKMLFILSFICLLNSCAIFFPPSVYERLLANGVIGEKKEEKAIYVSLLKGDDDYLGTNKNEPVKTIDIAIDRAVTYDIEKIKITSGEYIKNGGLNEPGVSITNIKKLYLIGGYNEDFSGISGITFLNGNSTEYIANVIFISNSKDIFLENFKISGYNVGSIFGVGLVIFNSTNINVKRCVFYNNYLSVYSQYTSAVLHVSSSSEIHIKESKFYSNNAPLYRIIQISDSSYCSLENVDCMSNSADFLIFLSAAKNIFLLSHVFDNSIGMLIQSFSNENITISGSIYNNVLKENLITITGNTNTRILNLYMATNSFTEASSNYINLYNDSSIYTSHLIISNCTFIATNNAIAIYEGYTNFTGHKIIGNKFKDIVLYYDRIIGLITNINDLNDKDKTGASEVWSNIILP